MVNDTYEVVGIRRAERTSKQTGKPYSGINLYCTYESPSIDGLGVENFFAMADRVPPGIRIGSIVRPLYNRWGKIESIEVVG